MEQYAASAKTLKSPSEGLKGRLDSCVIRESETLTILRQVLLRLRGSTPEQVNPRGDIPTPRDIPAMEHLQKLEELQSEVQRLSREVDNIV